MWGIIVLRSLIAIPLASFFVCVTGILSDIFREKERAFWLVSLKRNNNYCEETLNITKILEF